ncbi:MAG: carboxypeptidase regulatory-like domain-containing protein [Deltaproteobacteria bacterium]|nr:carboxypeptidase regulatory-like domain-containing protein [Deltaproteobacteria bacterium]
MPRRLAQLAACALLCGAAGTAVADDPPPDPPPAPVASRPAVLAGRITDLTNRPVANARIYVVHDGARLQARTDKDGRYTVPVATPGAYSVVVAVDQVHTQRMVQVEPNARTTLDVQVETVPGSEVIKIVDQPIKPTVMPVPKDTRFTKSLPYSTQAVLRDAWALAYVLLDVNEQGVVTRLKLLKRPGFDLDEIAIDAGFKLTFDPALDKDHKPMRTHILWKMEWPSWGWLVQTTGVASGRPPDHGMAYRVRPQGSGTRPNAASGGTTSWAQPLPVLPGMSLDRVPCAGSGPLDLDLRNRAYRDCSTPDLSLAPSLPWITRTNAKEVLAALDAAAPKLVLRPRRSRVPELIAGGASLALGATAIVSFVQYDRYSDKVGFGFGGSHGARTPAYEADAARMEKWRTLMLASAGAFVVSGAVTAFLWSRGQTRESFSVQPTNGGGAVSFGTTF